MKEIIKGLPMKAFILSHGLYAAEGANSEIYQEDMNKFQKAFQEYFDAFATQLNGVFNRRMTLEDMVKKDVINGLKTSLLGKDLGVDTYIYSLSFMEEHFPGFVRRLNQEYYALWLAGGLICGGDCFCKSNFGAVGNQGLSVETINLLEAGGNKIEAEPYLRKLSVYAMKNKPVRDWVKGKYNILFVPYLVAKWYDLIG